MACRGHRRGSAKGPLNSMQHNARLAVHAMISLPASDTDIAFMAGMLSIFLHNPHK